MDLLICTTPLQTIIAKEVLNKENINLDKVVFLYFIRKSMDTQQHRFYFEQLKDKVGYAEYIAYNSFIRIVIRLFMLSIKFSFDKVFLAIIDDNIAHFALSYMNYNKLITFDDGTANIVPNSIYFFPKSKNLRGKILNNIHKMLGKRKSISDVKKISVKHYTIYKDFQNVFENPVYIDVFKRDGLDVPCESNSLVKHVILGTMYDEITSCKADAMILKKLLLKFLNTLDKDNTIYIYHPRESNSEFRDYADKNNKIAEDNIYNFITEGYKINLYGFGSSCQFNMSGNLNVDNYLFYSDKINDIVLNSYSMLEVNSHANKVFLNHL